MLYTKDHEWLLVEGLRVKVGISNFAQEELGDIVFVDLPAIGSNLLKGDVAGVTESTKAAADLYAPISGKVVSVNQKLQDSPELINTHAESDGWIYELELADAAELEGLLASDAYHKLIGKKA